VSVLFAVIAKDGTDAAAPARRLAVRTQHLEGIRPLVEAGTVLLGGAILNDAGGMIGSLMLMEAESEAAARALLERDVYVTGGVWAQYELHPFRIAVQSETLGGNRNG
jgi:uncharacterized protein